MAQQSISQIRTVVAYNGEEVAMKQYEKALEDPVKVSARASAGVRESVGWWQLTTKQYEKALEDPVKVSLAEEVETSVGKGESEGMGLEWDKRLASDLVAPSLLPVRSASIRAWWRACARAQCMPSSSSPMHWPSSTVREP